MKSLLLRTLACTFLLMLAAPIGKAEAVPIARDLAAFQLNNSHNPFELDIDVDGFADLQFWHFVNSDGPQADVLAFNWPLPPGSRQIWRYEPINNFAAALSTPLSVSGFLAGDADLFEPDAPASDYNPWLALNGVPAYFGGLLFISGDPHQFWVRMSVDPDDGLLTFYEVGYESDVYQATQIPEVPEPSTLSLLAIGTGLAYRFHTRSAPK
jgi:hypothetical protein